MIGFDVAASLWALWERENCCWMSPFAPASGAACIVLVDRQARQ